MDGGNEGVMAFTPKLMIVEPSAEDRRRLISAPFLRQQSEWDSEILRTHLRNIRHQIRYRHLSLSNRSVENLRAFTRLKVSFAENPRAVAEAGVNEMRRMQFKYPGRDGVARFSSY
jgi:hypothetical protein